jgi:cytochrome-b5 reductase
MNSSLLFANPLRSRASSSVPNHLRMLFLRTTLVSISLLSTMSKAHYAPPSLTGKPTKALVPPGKCQIPDEFLSVALLERVPVSPTSSVFRFGLPNPCAPLNLSTCACLLAKANIIRKNDDQQEDNAEEVVIRPYTPISTNELKGCFDLLVKDYGPGAKMSRHLHEIKVGDTIDFKPPSDNGKSPCWWEVLALRP